MAICERKFLFKTEDCGYSFRSLSEEVLRELDCLTDPSAEEIKEMKNAYIDILTEKKVYDQFIDHTFRECYFSDEEEEVSWEKFISTSKYRKELELVKVKVEKMFRYPDLKYYKGLFPAYVPELDRNPNCILRYCASFYTIPEKALASGMIIGLTDYGRWNCPSTDGFGQCTGLPYGYWYYINKKDEYTFEMRKIEIDYSSHLFNKHLLSGYNMPTFHFRSPQDFVRYYNDEEIWIEFEPIPLPPEENFYLCTQDSEEDYWDEMDWCEDIENEEESSDSD